MLFADYILMNSFSFIIIKTPKLIWLQNVKSILNPCFGAVDNYMDVYHMRFCSQFLTVRNVSLSF